MTAINLLWACLLAALITLPPLCGFIAILYACGIHPSITGMLTALVAIIIARFVAVPVIRKIINRK